mgnify:CR=1 FL=1
MELLLPENSLDTTLIKALNEIDENWREYKGLICCGSWPGQDDNAFYEKNVYELKKAKGRGIPYLGICLGMQMIIKMEGGKLEKLEENRVGIKEVIGWWGITNESHWHRFAGREDIRGYQIVKTDGIIEAMRLEYHPFFVGTQFHPEYQSSKDKPHPILKEFLEVCSAE